MPKVTYKGGREIGPKRTKDKVYWWRYLLVFLSGMVATVVVLFATGVIGATAYTAKEVIYLFNGNPDDLLQEEYQNLSILEMVTTLSQKKFETLGDINAVTPLVKKTLDEQINPILERELHYQFPWEEISIKPFKLPASDRPIEEVDPDESLDTYIGRAIKQGVTLSSFINPDFAPDLVDIFLYPKDNEGHFNYDQPYTLLDYIDADADFFDNIINSVTVGDITGVTEGEGFLPAIAHLTIGDLTEETIGELSLGLFLPSSSTNLLIQELSTWKISDLQDTDKFYNLEIGQLIEKGENTPLFVVYLIDEHYTIGTLQNTNLYNVLTVGDVFDTTGSDFLNALATFTLSDLQNDQTILGLKLIEIFPDNEIFQRLDEDTTVGDLTDVGWLSSLRIDQIYSPEEIQASSILTALQDRTIGELSDPSVLQTLTIGDVLDPLPDNAIIEHLAPYQIGQIASEINNITLGELLGFEDMENPTKLMDTLSGATIGNLQSTLDSLTVGDVMDLSTYPNQEVATKIANTSIYDFESIIDDIKSAMKIEDVIDIYESGPDKSPEILIYLKGTYLEDIGDKVLEMKLSDALSPSEIASSPLLGSLANVTLFDGESLVNKINNLELCDVFTKEQCTGVLETIWNNYWDPVTDTGGHVAITGLPNALNNLPLYQLLDEFMYEDPGTPGATKVIDDVTYKRIKPVWWYMFTEIGESFNAEEKYYVLKNGKNYKVDGGFDHMVTNVKDHINSESIRDLYNAGLLNLQPTQVYLLNYSIDGYAGKDTVGDLTLSEFFTYCMTIVIEHS